MYQIFTGSTLIYTPAGIDEKYKVINPQLTQSLNKAGQLTFTLPRGNNVYGSLREMVSPVSVYKDGEEIFFGRVTSIETNFWGERVVECEGALAFLNDVVIRPFEYTNTSATAVKKYLNYVLERYNAGLGAEDAWKQISVGDVTVSRSSIYRYKETYMSAFEVISDHTIKSTLGGYLSARRENGQTLLDYTEQAGGTSSQYIRYGRNLVDLLHKTSAGSIFTVLLPLGKEVNGVRVDIKSVNGGLDYIESEDGISEWGRIWATKNYDDITEPGNLLAAAQADLALGINESVSLSLTAVDLHDLGLEADDIRCGDTVPVYSEPHGINASFVCNSTTIVLNAPESSVYSLGAEEKGYIEQTMVIKR